MLKRSYSRFLLLGYMVTVASSQTVGAIETIDETTSSISPNIAIQTIENEILTNEQIKIEAQRTSDLRQAVKSAEILASDLSLAPDTPLDMALLPQKKLASDEIFIKSWKAYQSGQLNQLEQTKIELPQEHPLKEYLNLWIHNLRLKKDIDDPTRNIEFVNFIDRFQGTYLSERAAADYLSIVEDRINSTLFNYLYQRLRWNQSEPELKAWNYFYNYSSYTTEEIQNFLKNNRLTGLALNRLLGKVLQDNPSWYWTAIVLLMQKEQWEETLSLINAIPEEQLPASRITLRSILKNPVRWYERYGHHLKQKPLRLSVFVSLRLASIQPELAAQTADRIIPQLSQTWSDLLNASLSFHYSVGQSTKALERFEKIQFSLKSNPIIYNPSQIQIWAIKAYLREENWQAVHHLIDQLPENMQKEDIWVYWKARAKEAMGDTDQARQLYKSISHNFDFYGKLASDALGEPYPEIPPVPPLLSKSPDWSRQPSLQRAIHFYRMELFGLGHREWNWAMREINQKDFLSLADFALRNHLIHRMINTSLRSGSEHINIHQRFPTPQQTLFKTVCTGQDIPPSWAYGLIRQESRFMLTVSSTVGARGLMQIMPSTARWLAQKLELKDYEHNRLTDLEMNLILGTSYLRMLKSEFDGNLVLATASYNAGTRRVRQWLGTIRTNMPADIFIETIPFFETRDYVKNVMSNMHTYGILLGLPQERFSETLGSITPSHVPNTNDLP